jgi:hypothetical protein
LAKPRPSTYRANVKKASNTGQNGPGRPAGSGAASGGGLAAKPQDPHANAYATSGLTATPLGAAAVQPQVTTHPTQAPARPNTGYGNIHVTKPSTTPANPGINPMQTTSTSKSAGRRAVSLAVALGQLSSSNKTASLAAHVRRNMTALGNKTASLHARTNNVGGGMIRGGVLGSLLGAGAGAGAGLLARHLTNQAHPDGIPIPGGPDAAWEFTNDEDGNISSSKTMPIEHLPVPGHAAFAVPGAALGGMLGGSAGVAAGGLHGLLKDPHEERHQEKETDMAKAKEKEEGVDRASLA